MKRLLAVLLILVPGLATAQDAARGCSERATIERVNLTDTRAVLARALRIRDRDIHTSGFFRRSIQSESYCADSVAFLKRWTLPPESLHYSVAPLPVGVANLTNSSYPRERNSGPLWAGVGFNSVASAGLRGHWRFVSGAAYPMFVYSQNKPFEIPLAESATRSEYANPYISGIDFPKRMGPSSISDFDPGNSYLQIEGGPVYAAFSNENIWVGPAQTHSLVLTNNAPGFPHVRFGTREAVDLKIVRAEFQVFFGSVTESDYFDGDNDNESHLFQGTVIALEPKILPGLHLGITRVLHDAEPATGHSLGYYLKQIIDAPVGMTDERSGTNGYGAVFARWVLPESGFEAYLEWGKEDFPFSWLNLLMIPDYAAAYTAGVQKSFVKNGRLARVYAEASNLGQGAPNRGGSHGVVRMYTHGEVPQGHTNRGQLLGSSIGPGSDVQSIGADVFTASSRTGILLERLRYDTDTYYEYFSRRYSESRYDVEITGELRRAQMIGPLEAEGVFRISRRFNRDYISALNATDLSAETNIGTEILLRWVPSF